MGEHVVDGVTGGLVVPGEPGKLADALVEAAFCPARRARWGEAARSRVASHFLVKRMIADYRRVFLEGASTATESRRFRCPAKATESALLSAKGRGPLTRGRHGEWKCPRWVSAGLTVRRCAFTSLGIRRGFRISRRPACCSACGSRTRTSSMRRLPGGSPRVD